MITVRCKVCNKELTSTRRVLSCGCPNQTTIVDNKIGAIDLDKVVMVTCEKEVKIDSHFSSEELAYQESRRRRRLDFDVR